VLHPDHGDRAENVPAGDHGLRLVQGHPPHLGGLVYVRRADLLRPAGQVQLLRVVGVADHRLAGQHVLDAARPPAGFLLNLACRRGGRVLAVIDIAARQLPHPAVHDEPVPQHQQHPFARIVRSRCGCRPG